MAFPLVDGLGEIDHQRRERAIAATFAGEAWAGFAPEEPHEKGPALSGREALLPPAPKARQFLGRRANRRAQRAAGKETRDQLDGWEQPRRLEFRGEVKRRDGLEAGLIHWRASLRRQLDVAQLCKGQRGGEGFDPRDEPQAERDRGFDALGICRDRAVPCWLEEGGLQHEAISIVRYAR